MAEESRGRYVTAQDAAARLNVHEQTVYSWIRRGKLKAAQFGGRRGPVRIPLEELERFEREGLGGSSEEHEIAPVLAAA